MNNWLDKLPVFCMAWVLAGVCVVLWGGLFTQDVPVNWICGFAAVPVTGLLIATVSLFWE